MSVRQPSIEQKREKEFKEDQHSLNNKQFLAKIYTNYSKKIEEVQEVLEYLDKTDKSKSGNDNVSAPNTVALLKKMCFITCTAAQELYIHQVLFQFIKAMYEGSINCTRGYGYMKVSMKFADLTKQLAGYSIKSNDDQLSKLKENLDQEFIKSIDISYDSYQRLRAIQDALYKYLDFSDEEFKDVIMKANEKITEPTSKISGETYKKYVEIRNKVCHQNGCSIDDFNKEITISTSDINNYIQLSTSFIQILHQKLTTKYQELSKNHK